MLDKAPPVALAGGERAFLADQQAGFLIGFAYRRKRDGASPGKARAPRAGGQLGFFLRMQAGGHRNAAVRGVGAAARKHEFARHEGMPCVAASHQDEEVAGAAVEQDQRRGIARPERPRTQRARFEPVDLGFAHAVHGDTVGHSQAGWKWLEIHPNFAFAPDDTRILSETPVAHGRAAATGRTLHNLFTGTWWQRGVRSSCCAKASIRWRWRRRNCRTEPPI